MKIRLSIILITIFTTLGLPSISYAYLKNVIIEVAPQSIEFHIENQAGNISGYTPNGIMSQIVEISFYNKISAISDPEPATEYEKFNELSPKIIPTNIVLGKYKFVVYGSTLPVNAAIFMQLDWSDDIKWYMGYRGYKLIYPDVVWSYEFDIPAAPINNGQITLTKISTPADLIKDITIAGQLGYIGNAHFVSETIEKINEIEKERTKPAEKDDDHKLTPAQKAKKEYTELLSEITEKHNKPEADEFVKQEAYTVLSEDIEYIIGHL